MHRKATAIFMTSLAIGLLGSGALAGAASALASWHFGGSPLFGSETINATATTSSFTLPGLTTTCEPLTIELEVENSGGHGTGVAIGVDFGACHTDSASCEVEAIEAESLPWAASLGTVAGEHYLILKGVRIVVFYSGPECLLSEIEMPITGSAGGLINEVTETVTFSPATFNATGTELKALGTKVEFNGFFQLAATGANSGLAVTPL